MRIKLADAPAVKRDKIEIVAHDFGVMVALNMALREGVWPSGEDMRRWCRLVALSDAGTTARLDSGALAHERMAIAKWRSLDARGWLHEADQAPAEVDEALRLAQLAERERWVADRVEELERERASSARAKLEAQAQREHRRRAS